MNCRELTGFLLEYFSGEMPAAVSTEFETHLGRCSDCHAFLEQYRQTIALGRATAIDEHPNVPEGLIAAIVASIKTAS